MKKQKENYLKNLKRAVSKELFEKGILSKEIWLKIVSTLYPSKKGLSVKKLSTELRRSEKFIQENINALEKMNLLSYSSEDNAYSLNNNFRKNISIGLSDLAISESPHVINKKLKR